MVVTGLGLLFGGRGDPARVRPGTRPGHEWKGQLRIDPGGPRRQSRSARRGAEKLDGRPSRSSSRSVSAEGRSRPYAGGRAVPVSLLTYLADELVAVHGQADQQQLLKPDGSRTAGQVRRAGKLAAVLAGCQRAFRRHRKGREGLTVLTARARERTGGGRTAGRPRPRSTRLNPAAGEEAELRAEEERLAHADALHAAATAAHQALVGDPHRGYEGVDAAALLTGARQALDGVSEHDTALASLAARLAEVSVRRRRRGGRAGLLRPVRGGRPGQAGGRPGGAAEAGRADPDVRRPQRWHCRPRRGAGLGAGSLGRLAELDGADDLVSGLAAEEGELAAADRRSGHAADRAARPGRGPVRRRRDRRARPR